MHYRQAMQVWPHMRFSRPQGASKMPVEVVSQTHALLDKISSSVWDNAIDRTIPPCPYSVRRNFHIYAKMPPIVSNGGVLL